ncbi:histone deacetylase [Atractiella rhizophila]|nr:histone deacetylase [Atractiella rhizophila]
MAYPSPASSPTAKLLPVSNALGGGVGTSKRDVAYYYDEDIACYGYTPTHPMRPHRIHITHNLIQAYELDQRMDVIRPNRPTPQQLTTFHTDEYIDILYNLNLNLDQKYFDKATGGGKRFLVGDDCPAFSGIYDFCSISAGGSIAGARRLNSRKADIAINWAGGLHHAKKRESSGFCYVNDIVLGILELLKYHTRVLYIDIDLHHGDGVEEAFYTTDRVLTCSFHKYDGDFFPATGALEDLGQGKGKNYAINVPLKDGIDDETFMRVFQPVVRNIIQHYQPTAIVLQCGADSLSGDRLGYFNLTMEGHAACVAFVRSFNIPTMLLGGGGYTVRNVARAWAYETATAIGCQMELSREIPWNDFYEWFGPEYKLEIPMTNAPNANTDKDMQRIVETITERLRALPHAPSVGSRILSTQDGESSDEESDPEIPPSAILDGIRPPSPQLELPIDLSELGSPIRAGKRSRRHYESRTPSPPGDKDSEYHSRRTPQIQNEEWGYVVGSSLERRKQPSRLSSKNSRGVANIAMPLLPPHPTTSLTTTQTVLS